ncbi:MAG: histidine kinase [Bacteroidia bacterium]|nr:histidine kinase [Bacteroidia bacterium]
MKNGKIRLFLWAMTIGILIPAYHVYGGEVPQSDTSQLISMAKNARNLLKNKKIADADSVIHAAFTLADSKKTEIPLLLHWAKAELAFHTKDIKDAFTSVIEAVKSPKDQIGPQSRGELNIFYARVLQFTGQFSNSIEILEKNLEFARSKHLNNVLPQTCIVLADVYELANQPDKAISSLEKMLGYAIAENDLSNAEIANARLGKARLTYRRDFALADKYYRQSFELSKQLGDSVRIAFALTNIAWNFYLEKQLDSSLHYYDQSLSFSLPVKRYGLIANSYGNIGTIYRDLKEYGKARSAWMKGLEYARIIKDWYSLSWIYEDMSKMSAGTGDYKDAYECHLLYKQYSDSVGNQNYSEGLAQARAKFDTDSKEKELQLLSLRLKNQQLLLYGFAGFLLLSIAIGLLLLRQSKLNAKRRISEMDQKILEVTQANLRQQMNPHFIFNTLNSIQYYMYKHDKLATNNYLTKFSNLMRKILENSRHTSVPVRDELDALQLYLELESIRFRDKFDYKITLDEEVDPLMYKIPTMLIQPYVENAICHGLMLRPEKGMVNISLTLEKDYLACIIEDNGIGREASMEINQKKHHNHNSLGTHITESRLKLVSSLYGTSLKTTYTDLKDENGNAAGTRVEIHIPILT